jgi:phospholipid-binding lipoprotein MlaA
MRRRGSRAPWMPIFLFLCGVLPGCATNGPDPLESWNRPVFAFNEGVDKYVLEPVATGWDAVAPDAVQTGVRNFFDNLNMPVTLLNDLLQWKPLAAVQDLGRILVNTIAGVGGLIDVASMIEIPENQEDFGQTLGRYGVPAGAYLVIPVLGSSSVRDVWKYPADAAATPHIYFVPRWVSYAARAVEMVNLRAYYLEEVREDRESAFDFYVFVRNAYLQNRRRKVTDTTEQPSELQDDLYEFEDDE